MLVTVAACWERRLLAGTWESVNTSSVRVEAPRITAWLSSPGSGTSALSEGDRLTWTLATQAVYMGTCQNDHRELYLTGRSDGLIL